MNHTHAVLWIVLAVLLFLAAGPIVHGIWIMIKAVVFIAAVLIIVFWWLKRMIRKEWEKDRKS